MRAASLQSVIDNFAILSEMWKLAMDVVRDSETRARLIGISTIMKLFDYLFGVLLGLRVLRHTDNLSKTLQSPSLSAIDAHVCAKLTVSTLHGIRNDNSFNLFWAIVLQHQSHLDLLPPKLPRKCRARARLAEGAKPFHHTTPEAVYRHEFFAIIDLVTNCIEQRFNQPGYNSVVMFEKALLSVADGKLPDEEMLESIMPHTCGDVDRKRLVTQLEMLSTAMHSSSQPSLRDVRDYLCSLSPDQWYNLSEVCTLLKHIVVSPATNSVNERGTSALQRVKSYLRSTRSQERLNHLLLMHTHNIHVDALDLNACLQEFVETKEHRKDVFGKFH